MPHSNARYDFADFDAISLEHFEKLKQFEVFENDIIVSCVGTIGEIFRIPKNAPKGIINQALMKIKLVNEEWIPYFMIFLIFLLSKNLKKTAKVQLLKYSTARYFKKLHYPPAATTRARIYHSNFRHPFHTQKGLKGRVDSNSRI